MAASKPLTAFNLCFTIFILTLTGVRSWTGEIHGRVVCDVCGDSSIGPEDHVIQGAEVAVLCITRSGEVLNYEPERSVRGGRDDAGERTLGCMSGQGHQQLPQPLHAFRRG